MEHQLGQFIKTQNIAVFVQLRNISRAHVVRHVHLTAAIKNVCGFQFSQKSYSNYYFCHHFTKFLRTIPGSPFQHMERKKSKRLTTLSINFENFRSWKELFNFFVLFFDDKLGE